ncbi:DUF423 domain-containing protein [Abyssibacter profundi]|uniref:DUF423 domain-containing protein n=1 Tax=Abyssibacter profundi TaxID=2182787 RepID=A0A363UNQ0_9GAMM|nr:DUF423 domain-containing protein [Abyssibacter profundi]PWN57058.1 DUF423 domain-containing protein [Abyssibacter profundi]
MPNPWLALAALFGFLGVAFGAFGAHALRARLSSDMLRVWETAVNYQFWHALALLAVGILVLRGSSAWLTAAGSLFALGVLLFSGSLYALALSGVRGLGAITPVGGVLLLGGWICLLVASTRLS